MNNVCAFRLCLIVIIALPAATPKELKNSVNYALSDFTNRACISLSSGLTSLNLCSLNTFGSV
jgi:hypothetical protein